MLKILHRQYIIYLRKVKSMKKALALILSMAMILTMALPVSAADLFAEKIYMLRGSANDILIVTVGDKTYEVDATTEEEAIWAPAIANAIMEVINADPPSNVEVSQHERDASGRDISVKSKSAGAGGNALVGLAITKADGSAPDFTYLEDETATLLVAEDGRRLAVATGQNLGSIPFANSFDGALKYAVNGTEWFYSSVWDEDEGSFVGDHAMPNSGNPGGYDALIYWDGVYLNVQIAGGWTGFWNPDDLDDYLNTDNLGQFIVDNVTIGLNFFKGYNATFRVPVIAPEAAVFTDSNGQDLRGAAAAPYLTASSDIDFGADTAVVTLQMNINALIAAGLVDADSFLAGANVGMYITIYDVEFFGRAFEDRGKWDPEDLRNFPGSIWNDIILDIHCNLDGGNSFGAAGYFTLSGGEALPVVTLPATIDPDTDDDDAPPPDAAEVSPLVPTTRPTIGSTGALISREAGVWRIRIPFGWSVIITKR